MTMSNDNAVMIVTGEIKPEDDNQLFDAWQHVLDNGLAGKLRGWYARKAKDTTQRRREILGVAS